MLLAFVGKARAGDLYYGDAQVDVTVTIDVNDILRIRQNAGGYTGVPLRGNADASGHDCRLAVSDALVIHQYLLGFRSDLPISIPPKCWAFELSITNGDGQEGLPNQTLPQPLEVTLNNFPTCTQTISGCTLGGVTVTYEITDDSTGGALLSTGVTKSDINTDSSGTVSTLLTMGPGPGAVTIVGSVDLYSAEGGLLTTISALFTEKAIGVNIASPAAGVCLNTSQTDVTVTTNSADGNTVTLTVNGSVATVNGGNPLPPIFSSGGQATINNVDLPEGPVTFIVSISGADSDPVSITVDLTPPTVDVDGPISCDTDGDVTISASCDDVGTGVLAGSCEVSIDGGVNWYDSPHLYTGLTDGNYTAVGQVSDNCGNSGSDAVGETFDVDTVAAVSITYPSDGETIPVGDVSVSGTADTDITSVTVTSDQGHSESSPVVAGVWTVTLTGVSTPSIVITAEGTDDCGNTGSDLVTVPVIFPICIWDQSNWDQCKWWD